MPLSFMAWKIEEAPRAWSDPLSDLRKMVNGVFFWRTSAVGPAPDPMPATY